MIGDDVRPPTWSSGKSRDGGNLRFRKGISWETSLRFPPVGHIASGMPLPVDECAVLAARPCAVNRAGPASGPRRAARTWEETITVRDRSSRLAARSLANNTSWSRSQTPASFQAASRRKHVMPEPKSVPCGRNLHWIPGVQHEQDPAQRWAVRHSRPTGHQFRCRIRQKPPDQRPRFVRGDPRTRLSFPHEQPNEHPSQQSQHQRLL